MQTSLRISKPLLLFCGFFLVAQFFNGLSTARNVFGIPNVWYSLAFYWALGWWFINDSRRHGITWPDKYMDMGLLLYIAWIFVVPYYLFKTRGWKVIYILGVLLGIYIGAFVTGAVFSLLIGLF